MSAITVGGDLVHYEVLGRGGKPVILAHSWLGSWRYWIPTMRMLQLKFRVYAVDLFGYGDSSKNPARYGIDHQVLLLDELMKQLGLPKVAMIGHGLGAQVMTEFASREPDRVARILICNAPLFNVPDLKNREPSQVRRVMLTGQNAQQPLKSGIDEPLADISTLDKDQVQNNADSVADPTVLSASNVTIRNPRMIDRDKLREAALARGAAIMRGDDQLEPSIALTGSGSSKNQLSDALDDSMDALLAKCFKKSEPEYDKLQSDVERSDDDVLRYSSHGFDAGAMLDKLRLLDIPAVVVHGNDDPIIKLPGDEVWDYITLNKDDKLLPVPLPSVRHFPMLEAETFTRLVSSFLETPDISKIEVKERWRRRAR